ncbi:hypothetical protein PV392_27635 [Streptomyces sp. ME03-5709C]|nr:hypothetical protein [Streptomyces sp. ME03-5709C]
MQVNSIGFRIVTAAITSIAALLLATSPAQAETTFYVNDNCDVSWITCSYGDLNVNYNTMQYGLTSDGHLLTSYASFYGNVPDYAGASRYEGSSLVTYVYVFGNGGNGNGQRMKNNAGSVWNCAPEDNYRIYYNSGYVGHSQYIRNAYYGSCYWTDLDSTLHDQNASQHWA